MNEKKQMFINVDINIFIPKDIERHMTSSKKLEDILDEEPETLERL